MYADHSVNVYGEGAQCERKRERTENGGMKNISGLKKSAAVRCEWIHKICCLIK